MESKAVMPSRAELRSPPLSICSQQLFLRTDRCQTHWRLWRHSSDKADTGPQDFRLTFYRDRVQRNQVNTEMFRLCQVLYRLSGAVMLGREWIGIEKWRAGL